LRLIWEQVKFSEYGQREINLAKYAKALSHPARLAILKFLLKKNTCICGDIVDELPLSQSTVSHAFEGVKRCGID